MFLNSIIVKLYVNINFIRNAIIILLTTLFVFLNDPVFCEATIVEETPTCGIDMPRGTVCPKCGETKEFWENQTWYERNGFIIVVTLIPVCITFSILQYIYLW